MQRGAVDPADKYNADDLPESYVQPYLEKVSENYKTEANEQLKMEFNQWLQGTHPSNQTAMIYPNRQGQTKRVHMKPGVDVYGQPYVVGQQKDDFNVTPWGMQGLTQLEGVRDYLRSQREKAAQNDFALNVLAEEGPQNLEEAWQYFKTWVKGRPQSEGALDLGYHYDRGPFPRNLPRDPTNTKRSDFGNKQPDRTVGYPLTDTDWGRSLLRDPETAQLAATVQDERLRVRADLEEGRRQAADLAEQIQREQVEVTRAVDFNTAIAHEPVNWSPAAAWPDLPGEAGDDALDEFDEEVLQPAANAGAEALEAVEATVGEATAGAQRVIDHMAEPPEVTDTDSAIEVMEQHLAETQARLSAALDGLADEGFVAPSPGLTPFTASASGGGPVFDISTMRQPELEPEVVRPLTGQSRRVSFAATPRTVPAPRQRTAAEAFEGTPIAQSRVTMTPGGRPAGSYADFDPTRALQA